MVLSQEEIDGCREVFLNFDRDRSGSIDIWELRQVLEAMGQRPTEEELFLMISEVDDNMSGSIDFAEFIKVIETQKDRAENFDANLDMLDAFVACGGGADTGGHVLRERLVKIIKQGTVFSLLISYGGSCYIDSNRPETTSNPSPHAPHCPFVVSHKL
jgi:calmodulin